MRLVLAVTGVALGVTIGCAGNQATPTRPAPVTTAPAVVNLLVSNVSAVSQASSVSVQLAVTARFSDGSIQDVTSSATWMTSDVAIATVIAGSVRFHTAGRVLITVSFGSATTQVEVSSASFSGPSRS